MKDLKVLYLCDKQKDDCKKTNCSEEFCHHTSDVSHAINFKKIVDTASGEVVGYAEKESGWNPIKMRPGTDEEYEEFSLYGDCPREDFRVFECHLPNDGQEVLVTTQWGTVCIDTWHRDVDCCYFENNSDDDDVIAWMPLPEGYKKEVQHEDS